MGNLYFSAELSDGRMLYLATLSSRRLEACPEPIDDTSGYFLFEDTGSESAPQINIIAQVHSDEAALRISSMLNMV